MNSKIFTLKLRFLTVFLLLFVLPITLVLAQSGASGLVPCGRTEPDCSLNQLFDLIGNVMNKIVFVIAVPLAIIVIVWAGAILVLFPANEGRRKEAITALWATVIGLTLTLGSYLVIKTILETLTTGGSSKYLGI